MHLYDTPGYRRSLQLLHRVAGPGGFLASPSDSANYRRVWARDGVICGLAALLSGDADLIAALDRTLETLCRHQGPHGEIPSNVGADGAVSYGSLVGRVDAPLWYVIGCASLASRDQRVLVRHADAMRKALWLCGAWEFNGRGLIYVPMGGSWADEYILHGYVLHVQLLYLWALQAAGRVFGESEYLAKAGRLAQLISENYWAGETVPTDAGHPPRGTYHPGAYSRLTSGAERHPYWLAGFHPEGYDTMFDGLSNGLALMLGLGHGYSVGAYTEQVAADLGTHLTPAFYPAITPADSRWSQLAGYFAYHFRNEPWAYHNGGLWPMVTGFMAAGLAAAGQSVRGLKLVAAIDTVNAAGNWGFYEFHHGRSHTPGGVRETAWSAAGAVIGYHAVREGLTPAML